MRTMMAHARTLVTAAALLFAAPAFADGPGDTGPDVGAPVRAAPVTQAPPVAEPAAITGQSGQISLAGGDLSLNVPAGYKFYSAEQALAFLQRNGAASPSGTVMGLLAPANTDITRPNAWATVVSYDEIGYVPGETASGLGDASFEAAVRSARQDQGRPFEGFAVQPAFDSTHAGLAWGERTGAPGAASGRDFRHEQRLLGRQGVAGLTSVGSADQMTEINAALPAMISMIAFPAGQTYADFAPASDAVSNYTIPSLVTGVAPLSPQAVAESAGAPATQTGMGGLAGLFPWIAGGVAVLAGAGYLLMRRRRDPELDGDEVEEERA